MRLRSSLGTLMQFFLVAGFLLEYIIGPYTSYLTLVIVSLATPILCFGMFVWMPDSPQSLLIRPGGEQKAMESLRWLRGNPQETALIKELEDIKVRSYIIYTSCRQARILTCFKRKGCFAKKLIIFVFYYVPNFFYWLLIVTVYSLILFHYTIFCNIIFSINLCC